MRRAHPTSGRDPVGQAAVFTATGRVRLFEGDPAGAAPVQVGAGREALAATFATDEGWRTTQRDLVLDWTDRRPSQP